MKIEWLNDQRTKAIITRGWFNKLQAEVFLYCEGGHWYYAIDGRDGPHLPWHIQEALNSARKRNGRYWKPVPKLPKAIVNE